MSSQTHDLKLQTTRQNGQFFFIFQNEITHLGSESEKKKKKKQFKQENFDVLKINF